MAMKTLPSNLPAAVLLLAVALHVAPAAADTTVQPPSSLRAQLQRDLAYCNSPGNALSPAECRREAYAAYQHARSTNRRAEPVVDPDNRFRRCDVFQGADREACIARVEGEGEVRGSVESGGIYREVVTVVPAPESSAQGSANPPR
jgi:hypothetical protein